MLPAQSFIRRHFSSSIGSTVEEKRGLPPKADHQLAQHVAGAVANFYLDIPIKYATIERRKDSFGHVAHYKARFFDRDGLLDKSPSASPASQPTPKRAFT